MWKWPRKKQLPAVHWRRLSRCWHPKPSFLNLGQIQNFKLWLKFKQIFMLIYSLQVADSLYFLLLDRPQCKLTFLSLQGPRYLVEILNTETNYIKLIYAVVRCIRSISTCRQNKASLTAIGNLFHKF